MNITSLVGALLLSALLSACVQPADPIGTVTQQLDVRSGSRIQFRQQKTTYSTADGLYMKDGGNYYFYDTTISHPCEIVDHGAAGKTCDPVDDIENVTIGVTMTQYLDSTCRTDSILATNVSDPKTVMKGLYYRDRTGDGSFIPANTTFLVGDEVLPRASIIYVIRGGTCYSGPVTSNRMFRITAQFPGPVITKTVAVEVAP